MTSRITISDLAAAAGVSKSSASAALNNKPGVSEQTRERVLALALEMGWSPSYAAQSLSSSRAGAIGLIISRSLGALSQGPFFMQFIEGIESVISPHNVALMLHVVDSVESEISAYEKWASQRRVDGVIIASATANDPRISAVERLQLPAVWGSGRYAGVGQDEGSASGVAQAFRYLARLGHTRIARVGGNPEFPPVQGRNHEFIALMEQAGFTPIIVDTDSSGLAGARAARALLLSPNPPTAIIFDGDLMAVAGLAVAAEMGVRVPEDLSILSWDDSALCEVTFPTLSAVRGSNTSYGALQAEQLLSLIAGEDARPLHLPEPVLVPRGSTGRITPRVSADH